MGFKQKSFLNQRIVSRVETCMIQGGNCIWLKEIRMQREDELNQQQIHEGYGGGCVID